MPGAREACLSIVRDPESADRQYWAFKVLSHATDDGEVLNTLYEAFRRPGPSRWLALAALCDIRPESATDVIVEALNSSDLWLRGHAIWAALTRGLVPPIDACLNTFVEGVSWGQRACGAHLVLKHGEEGEKVLEQMLREGSDTERVTAALALAGKGRDETFDILKEELFREPLDKIGRKVVLRALARMPGKLAAWIEADGEALTGTPAAAWAVAKSPEAKVGPVVETFLREGSPAVRAAAVRILARQKSTTFLPELRRILRECRPGKVAREAFRQMLRLGDAGQSTANEMLGSDAWTERKAAVALMRRWGSLTPEQRARAKKDPHIAVRLAARLHS